MPENIPRRAGKRQRAHDGLHSFFEEPQGADAIDCPEGGPTEAELPGATAVVRPCQDAAESQEHGNKAALVVQLYRLQRVVSGLSPMEGRSEEVPADFVSALEESSPQLVRAYLADRARRVGTAELDMSTPSPRSDSQAKPAEAPARSMPSLSTVLGASPRPTAPTSSQNEVRPGEPPDDLTPGKRLAARKQVRRAMKQEQRQLSRAVLEPSQQEDAPPVRAGRSGLERRAGKAEAVHHLKRRDDAKERARARAWASKWLARSAELGLEPAHAPPCIPAECWAMCWEIERDATGNAGRQWLRWARFRYSGVPLAKLREAAFCPLGDGIFRFTWQDERARRIVALGLLLLRLGARTRRRDHWGRCVRGITREALAAALAIQHDQPVSHSVLSGTWYRDVERPLWQCGYLVALHRVGFLYRQQLPAHATSVAPWEIYSDRHGIPRTANRYWLCTPMMFAHLDDGDDLAVLHECGWWLCDELFVRQIRTAAAWRWAERHVGRESVPG